ncbi:MAG: chromate transporter [Clostridia bacterium]|nr:chromate transporter [Clostridia bacterium]
MKIFWQLFITFAKIGAVTFGGGIAMLPMFKRELVENKDWITENELTDYYAVGQCTPGIIAVNTATFVGYKVKGILGAIVATLGMIFPSLVIIVALAALISNFADLAIVQHAFAGIRACVLALVVSSVITLAKKAVIDKIGVVIFIAVALLSTFLDISPVIFVIITAALGIAINVKKEKSK